MVVPRVRILCGLEEEELRVFVYVDILVVDIFHQCHHTQVRMWVAGVDGTYTTPAYCLLVCVSRRCSQHMHRAHQHHHSREHLTIGYTITLTCAQGISPEIAKISINSPRFL